MGPGLGMARAGEGQRSALMRKQDLRGYEGRGSGNSRSLEEGDPKLQHVCGRGEERPMCMWAGVLECH